MNISKQLSFIPLFILVAINASGQINIEPKSPNGVFDTTVVPTKMDINFEKVTVGIAKVSFKELTHDFGNIIQNVPAEYNFEFTNTGTEVVAVEEVKNGCGCTTPEWTRNPIAKGAKSNIKAIYNSSEVGNFSKSFTVKFSNGEFFILTLKGVVER